MTLLDCYNEDDETFTKNLESNTASIFAHSDNTGCFHTTLAFWGGGCTRSNRRPLLHCFHRIHTCLFLAFGGNYYGKDMADYSYTELCNNTAEDLGLGFSRLGSGFDSGMGVLALTRAWHVCMSLKS
jgi:hypothetical protein